MIAPVQPQVKTIRARAVANLTFPFSYPKICLTLGAAGLLGYGWRRRRAG
jgi:hypothetical protein